MRLRTALLLLSLFCTSTSVVAEVIPSTGDSRFGWTRGDADTFYSGWDVFSDENGFGGSILDSTPDLAGRNGPNGNFASLLETSNSAFVTGTGNIYSFESGTSLPGLPPGGPSIFEVTIPSFNNGLGFNTRLVVQFKTLGNELDYSSLFVDGVVPTFTTETARVELGPQGQGGGFDVSYLASWDFAQTKDSFFLTFAAQSGSMALDRLHIDGAVTAVPEPASLAVLSLAAVGGIAARVRRKRQPAS